MNKYHRETNFENFVWIDICNPERKDLENIALEYSLDYYQIVDSLQAGHLPKIEKHKSYSFIILRAFTANYKNRITNINSLSNKMAFFVGEKKLITIHRAKFNFLENLPLVPSQSEELVLYLIHKMMQTFENPTKNLEDKNDEIEKTIFLKDFSRISLEDIYYLKMQARITKKLLQMTQNILLQLDVTTNNQTSLQDIKDRLLSLVLSHEEILENSNNLLHTYMSFNEQKSNDVMKLLTIFSAFFLPLTFIVGVYGMNFRNMPELDWQNGYFLVLALMFAISLVIYFWFKRRKIL